MPEEIKKLNAKEEEFFSNWKKDLEQIVKSKQSFPLDKTHLLQCPASVRLAQQNKEVKTTLFKYWGREAIINYGHTKYLKFKKLTKPNSPVIEKPLPIIKSYQAGTNDKKGEKMALTFLMEQPSGTRICNQTGNYVEPYGYGYKYPVALGEDSKETLRTRAYDTIQQLLTPIGKKGIVVFHTKQQYMKLDEVPSGEFQRFFISPTPEYGLVRVAHTLRKLSGGDPKNIDKVIKNLTRVYQEKLKQLSTSIISEIKTTTEYSFLDNLQKDAEYFPRYLPRIEIAEEREFKIELTPERSSGYTYLTSAVSLSLGADKNEVEKNNETIQKIWKTLSK